MKSNLGNINDCCVEKPFPKLVKMVRSGNIYLMFDEERGTKVHVADGCSTLGYRMAGVCPSRYRDYEGSVTLCND